MRTKLRTSIIGATAMVSVVGLAGMTPAATAAPADLPALAGDVDGDGLADLIVGVPEHANGRGAVDFRYTTRESELLKHSVVTGNPEGTAQPGDHFGAAVVTVDVNQDGYSDALIGAPGRGGGHVYLVYGGPEGLSTDDVVDVQPDSVQAGDSFGAALAINAHPDGGLNVWIGAPGDDVGGVENTGSIRQYRLVNTETGPDLELLVRLHQGADDIPGSNEKGDHFGEVIDASPSVAVFGMPDENVGDHANAGVAIALRLDESNDVAIAQQLSQRGDAPGAPEQGDHFGAAISSGFGNALIGAPGENVDGAANAGSVALYEMDGTGRLHPERTINQGSKRIPGAIEAGDRFGSSVVLGLALVCAHGVDAAIGAPGEDVDGIDEAGQVTMMFLSGEDECRAPFALTQGNNGLSGKPEQGDRLGAFLAVKPERADISEGEHIHFEQVFIGAPGENVNGDDNAGLVHLSPRASAPGGISPIIVGDEPQNSVSFSKGADEGLRYGEVIASV